MCESCDDARRLEVENARLRAALAQIKDNTLVMSHAHALACRALEQEGPP